MIQNKESYDLLHLNSTSTLYSQFNWFSLKKDRATGLVGRSVEHEVPVDCHFEVFFIVNQSLKCHCPYLADINESEA